ncbi:MAG: hypothetical protein E6J42_01145 [Chloroflexi bacterium]|nr:MAG: hypothetical protein E6J42_01145 [Chloroflexota bacterium]
MTCPRCGHFYVSGTAELALRGEPLDDQQRANASGWIRSRGEITVSSDDVEALRSLETPSLDERSRWLLRYLADRTKAMGQHVDVKFGDQEILAISRCQGSVDLNYILDYMIEKRLITTLGQKTLGGIRAIVTPTGSDYLQGATTTPTPRPVTPSPAGREFAFVKDGSLRVCLERDYAEIQRAYDAKCWKSVIILSGGAIEAILLDLLQADPARALQATGAPKRPDLTKWDLADLINVAVELNLVAAGVDKLSHPIRSYRNLVHPGNELRTGLKFGGEEAKIALEVLHILHRDLTPGP